MDILITREGYDEFKLFLDQNNIRTYRIRINLVTFICSGPIFNITEETGELREKDMCTEVEEISFIADEKLVEEFGGFEILSNRESGYNGLTLKPIILTEGGCESCTKKCH